MNEKIVYAPWTPSNLQITIDRYTKGEMPFLYLELTGKCTKCKCLYCDSPTQDVKDELSLDEIKFCIDKFANKGLRWLFICGLGEPSEDEKLIPLLSYLNEKNIKASLFTNSLGFSENDIQLLKEYDAHLILKLDTFKKNIFDELLGSKGSALKIYSFLESLLSQGFVKLGSHNDTNLALSIVPTALNINYIPEIIQYCVNHSIYPAIGEMEHLGRAVENLSKLEVSSDDLQILHEKVSKILGYSYLRPLCPGIIADFRIDHIGNCIIDSTTGLGCGWFLGEKYNPLVLGNIREDSINDIKKKASLYRCKCFEDAVNILNNKKPVIACGGGSRPIEWSNIYFQLMNKYFEKNLIK
jgi:MoaA/NifB/PqqE/SkfB family radical SAM enzyme